MKNLFREHSYDMVKMFLNQFAIAIFGFSLALAAGKAGNAVLRNATSIGAILFYLFLLYTMTWELGFKDRNAVLHGTKPMRPFKGALIALIANIPNLILATFVALGFWIQIPFFGNAGSVCKIAALLLEGMYTGILSHPVGGVALHNQWFMYFVITLPAIFTCGLSYFLGLKDIKFTSLLNQEYPESDREPKQKKWGR